MQDKDMAALAAAIAALEGQRSTLGDAVLELAVAPLRSSLAALQWPAGLQRRQITAPRDELHVLHRAADRSCQGSLAGAACAWTSKATPV